MSDDDDTSRNTGWWLDIDGIIEILVEGISTIGSLIKAIINIFD